MGTTRELVEKGDPSPYLSVENIDPEWLKAIGYEGKIDNEGAVQGRGKRKRELNDKGEGVVKKRGEFEG